MHGRRNLRRSQTQHVQIHPERVLEARKQMRKLVLLSLMLGVSGCGVADKVAARNEYKASLAQYRDCLRENTDAHACDNLKRLVATNERAFNTMAAGIHRGNYAVSDVTPMD